MKYEQWIRPKSLLTTCNNKTSDARALVRPSWYNKELDHKCALIKSIIVVFWLIDITPTGQYHSLLNISQLISNKVDCDRVPSKLERDVWSHFAVTVRSAHAPGRLIALHEPAGGKRLHCELRSALSDAHNASHMEDVAVVRIIFIIIITFKCYDLRNYYRFWHILACANAYGRRVLKLGRNMIQKTKSMTLWDNSF